MKWNEDKGWGFLEATEPCTKDYWAEYRALDQTPMGRVLTALRAGFVTGLVTSRLQRLVDVGIGGGAFCDAMGYCLGIDVNPEALEWLGENRWDCDTPVQTMTFWDSIEHIAKPGKYLVKASHMVFLSTPIYRNQAHALSSKHYKPNEHLWYFTDHGIKMFMREYGFHCVAQNELETDAGREGIGSYAFGRRP